MPAATTIELIEKNVVWSGSSYLQSGAAVSPQLDKPESLRI